MSFGFIIIIIVYRISWEKTKWTVHNKYKHRNRPVLDIYKNNFKNRVLLTTKKHSRNVISIFYPQYWLQFLSTPIKSAQLVATATISRKFSVCNGQRTKLINECKDDFWISAISGNHYVARSRLFSLMIWIITPKYPQNGTLDL